MIVIYTSTSICMRVQCSTYVNASVRYLQTRLHSILFSLKLLAVCMSLSCSVSVSIVMNKIVGQNNHCILYDSNGGFYSQYNIHEN
jgi:hypothetical protein